MGYFLVLSKPASHCLPDYKGVYRFAPFPQSDNNKRFMLLWERSVQHIDKTMGISTELSVEELKEFTILASHELCEDFELIYFGEDFECPHKSEYYGVDVAGFSGYSILAGNFFPDFVKEKIYPNEIYRRFEEINQHFRPKLNANRLFARVEDAIDFLVEIGELSELCPGCIEDEEWRIVHIFKVL